jgi:hypothetical protein
MLAVAAVVVVSLPFLRDPDAPDRLDEPASSERRRLELAEDRDRALAALKELEFDHRTGKISDEDYRSLVGPLRRQAAEAMRALERPDTVNGTRKPINEREVAAVTRIDTPADRSGAPPLAVVDPPNVPEPTPAPSEPPAPVTVPEPSPVPSEPPAPVPSPEPTPEPSPPAPEPPPQAG